MTAAWLTVAEASEEFGVSATTLKRWAGDASVKGRRRGARLLEINRASLVARLANRRKPGRPRKETKG